MTPEDDWTDATPYAPIGGPPADTRCSFCGRGRDEEPGPGWVIAADATMCPRCLRSAASELLGYEEPPAQG